METKEEVNDQFDVMAKLCMDYRGKIIHSMTIVEDYIDDVLSLHFCSAEIKRVEFKFSILSSEAMNLKKKWNICFNLLRLHYPILLEYIDKSANLTFTTAKPNGNSLNKRIDQLIELRNVFAHRKFYATEQQIRDFDGKTIQLKVPKIKEGTWSTEHHLPLTLTPEYMDEMISEAGVILLMLEKMVPFIKAGKDITRKEGQIAFDKIQAIVKEKTKTDQKDKTK